MTVPLADESTLPAPYLLWPEPPYSTPPQFAIPAGYQLRPYRSGNEHALAPLFQNEGWSIDDRSWQEYLERVVPQGLFILWHTPSNAIIGTVGAIHNPRGGRYYFPFGGELAYLVVHPEHRGQGLGAVLSSQVILRLLSAGYHTIWVGVQGFRLPAIKTYLKLGFQPLLHQPDLAKRWQRICQSIGWPYTPEVWPTKVRSPMQSEE